MSWSVMASDKRDAALTEIEKQMATSRHEEPEQSIKDKVGEIIKLALDPLPEGQQVRITARGSQWMQFGPDGENAPRLIFNNLNVQIDIVPTDVV